MEIIIIEPPAGIATDEKLWAVVSEDSEPVYKSQVSDGSPLNQFTALTDLCAFNWPTMRLADIFEWQSRESMRIAAALRKLNTNKS